VEQVAFGIDQGFLERAKRVLGPLKRYHNHTVEGLEKIPTDGPMLLAVNHSLATYDGFLLGDTISDHTQRVPAALGDDLIFKTPVLAEWASQVGIRPANQANALELLQQGNMVFVAPGGMREALRPSNEAYTVRWENRKGFARMALRAQVPLILIGCPEADEVYKVYPSAVTKWVYKTFKVPLPLIRGLGPTLIPRPVKLTHKVADPIYPPPYDPAREEEQVDALHRQAVDTMNALLARD